MAWAWRPASGRTVSGNPHESTEEKYLVVDGGAGGHEGALERRQCTQTEGLIEENAKSAAVSETRMAVEARAHAGQQYTLWIHVVFLLYMEGLARAKRVVGRQRAVEQRMQRRVPRDGARLERNFLQAGCCEEVLHPFKFVPVVNVLLCNVVVIRQLSYALQVCVTHWASATPAMLRGWPLSAVRNELRSAEDPPPILKGLGFADCIVSQAKVILGAGSRPSCLCRCMHTFSQ